MEKLKEWFQPRTLIGAAVVILALLLMFEVLGIHLFEKVLGHWPLALIVIGAAMLYGSAGEKGRRGVPYVLIGFGLLFLLAQYHVFDLRWSGFILPLLLLLLGLYLLKPRLFKSSAGLKPAAKLDVYSVLGAGEFSSRSETLKSARIFCLLGGADVDLRKADTQENSIELEVLCLMGGVEIKLPPHWQASVKVMPLLGGVSNSSKCLAEELQAPRRFLQVKGYSILGGVDIKN